MSRHQHGPSQPLGWDEDCSICNPPDDMPGVADLVTSLVLAIRGARTDLQQRPETWRDEDAGYNAGLDRAAEIVRDTDLAASIFAWLETLAQDEGVREAVGCAAYPALDEFGIDMHEAAIFHANTAIAAFLDKARETR